MQIHELNTRTPGVYDYAALDTGSQTYKAQVGSLKPQYTSYDSANPTSWADVATMGSNTPISTFFERVTYIARNVRYLWKLIGSNDFSNVAETISGAIGNTALTTTATDLSGAIAEHEGDISDINADISTINGNLAVRIGTFIRSNGQGTGGNNFQIRQYGKIVVINGYIRDLAVTANTATTIGTITNVGLPSDDIRVRGAAGANAYTPQNDAYIVLTTAGALSVYTASAATHVYFNMTYVTN